MSRILTVTIFALTLAGCASQPSEPSYDKSAVPEAATAPRTRTEAALRCWLGIGPQGCGKNDGCNGGDGPLERVDYLGTNAAGAEVYEVRYRHADSVYVSAPPGRNGKIDQFWSRRGNPRGLRRSPLVGIPPQAIPVLIYTRPQNAPPAGCSHYLAAEQIDPPAPMPTQH